MFAVKAAVKSVPSIVMTLLVRNEDDILLENILFHYSQGVSRFIVMDNLSTDFTADLLHELSDLVPIDYMYQENDDYDQSAWVTKMARIAYHKYGADWVINNDADEFWVFPDFDATSFCQSLPTDVSGVVLTRHNAVLSDTNVSLPFSSHPSSTILFERISLNVMGSNLPGKCMHRGSKDVVVLQGNHDVKYLPGASIPRDDAFILHFPYRGFDQYCSKIALGGAAYARNSKLAKSIGITWREHFKMLGSNDLSAFWHNLHLSPQQLILHELDGLLFCYDSLSKRLFTLLGQWRRELSRSASSQFLSATEVAFKRYVTRVASPVKSNSGGTRSLPFNNLAFLVEGPRSHLKAVKNICLSVEEPCSLLDEFKVLRDAYSLFPSNESMLKYLSRLLYLRNPYQFRRLRADCGSSNLIINLSCQKYLSEAQSSSSSFAKMGYNTIVVVGDESSCGNCLSFEYSDRVLKLPVLDNYETLATKLFMALLVLELCSDVKCVVKVDDDLRLFDSARFAELLEQFMLDGIQYSGRVLNSKHSNQCHGWHVGKCAETSLHSKGYQYPMPPMYASGGFGYLLGSQMVKACASMFLSMPAFFEMNSVQLEDVFVGHAAAGFGINCETCFDNKVDTSFSDCEMAVLPGLKRTIDH